LIRRLLIAIHENAIEITAARAEPRIPKLKTNIKSGDKIAFIILDIPNIISGFFVSPRD
jgi:hypothetical protein